MTHNPSKPMGKIVDLRCSDRQVYAISTHGMLCVWDFTEDDEKFTQDMDISNPGIDLQYDKILIYG